MGEYRGPGPALQGPGPAVGAHHAGDRGIARMALLQLVEERQRVVVAGRYVAFILSDEVFGIHVN